MATSTELIHPEIPIFHPQSTAHKFHIICAHSWPEFGIGFNNKLPWHLKGDLQNFKTLTTTQTLNYVIMGRTTYDSLPASVRPLPDRYNIVITRDAELLQNAHTPTNLWYTT